MDRTTSPAFLRVTLGACDMEHWIDYLILITYFRIRVEVIGSALNRAFEVTADNFDDYYNINSVRKHGEIIDSAPSEYVV